MDFAVFITYIIVAIIRPLVWLIMSLAVVYFLWNIAEIIRKNDQPDAIAQLRERAFWGVIAIAIMAGLWGLVNILVNTFAGPAVGVRIPLPFLQNM
ncbi:MAG: hypothetical protein AAB628_00045 [Patescibacteria group bacterium]